MNETNTNASGSQNIGTGQGCGCQCAVQPCCAQPIIATDFTSSLEQTIKVLLPLALIAGIAYVIRHI